MLRVPLFGLDRSPRLLKCARHTRRTPPDVMASGSEEPVLWAFFCTLFLLTIPAVFRGWHSVRLFPPSRNQTTCLFKRAHAGRQLQEQECLSLKQTKDEVIRIAEEAGRAVLQVYHMQAKDWEVEIKEDGSPVTQADEESNYIISAGLKALAPQVPIVSEESTSRPYALRKAHQYTWSVDPIDGTRDFLDRTGNFTVNIALLKGSRPVLGVVLAPAQGKVYWAIRGQGAWLVELRRRRRRQPKRLHCSPFSLDDEGLVVLGAAAIPSLEVKALLRQLNKPVYQRLGSALKLVAVAEGSAHLYPRLVPTNEWDTAAADIVLEEAGGAVVQHRGTWEGSSKGRLKGWQGEMNAMQPSLKYNKRDLLNPLFVAACKLRRE